MSKAEERRLLTRMFDLGYRILDMPSERDRTICAFKTRGSRMTYSTATVVRLVAPERSWLAGEMKSRRAVKSRRRSRRAKR